MSKYTVTIGGHSTHGVELEVESIDAARDLAKSYGNTMDWAIVDDDNGVQVAEFRRDVNGNGMDWFDATFSQD